MATDTETRGRKTDEQRRLDQDAARALTIQQMAQAAREKSTPGLRVRPTWLDPIESLVNTHPSFADCRGEGATHEAHTAPADEKAHNKAIARGFVPVVNMGEHMRAGDDRLYKRPKWMQTDEIGAASDAHNRKAGQLDRSLTDGTTVGGTQLAVTETEETKGALE